jgi:hypothetical protein
VEHETKYAYVIYSYVNVDHGATATSTGNNGKANGGNGQVPVVLNWNVNSQCAAYTFGTGVEAGSANACSSGQVLATASTCDVKCGSGYVSQGEVTISCAADATTGAAVSGDIASDVACVECSSQLGCSVDVSSKCLTVGDTTKLACESAVAGYYVVGTGSEATATACSSQLGCCVDVSSTCLTVGDTTKLACESAAAGYYLNWTSLHATATECRGQVGCDNHTVATCLTIGDATKLACFTAATGYRLIGSGSEATVAELDANTISLDYGEGGVPVWV